MELLGFLELLDFLIFSSLKRLKNGGKKWWRLDFFAKI